MVGRGESGTRCRCGAVLALFLAVGTAESGTAEDAEGIEASGVARAAHLPAIVVKSVKEAAARLADPACAEIFSDFRDAKGRTMQQNLDELGVTGERYLAWLIFYDGQGKLLCERPNVATATVPGTRAVFVCAPQFSSIAQHKPGLAAALVIHEELHSLGLGENPPRSGAITAQVLRRCGP